MRPLIARLCWVSVGLTCSVAGLFGSVAGMRQIQEESQARTWPQTVALIQSDRLEKQHEGRLLTWCPRWTYAYSVAGKQYTSDASYPGNLAPEDCPDWENAALSALNRHPPGSLITVYYNPLHPGEAALKTQARRAPEILHIVIAGACFVAGVFLMIFIWRDTASTKARAGSR